MSFVEIWFRTPLAGALGWALLDSLWQGALIAAAFALLLLATRSPRVRYAAGCAAMIVMLAAFGLTLWSVFPVTARPPGIRPPHRLPAFDIAAGLASLQPANSWLSAATPWLASLWIVGVWIFCLRQAAGWIPVYRLRRRGICCAPEPWQTELARLRAKLRVSRPVLLMESSLAQVPLVLGHLRPLVLMPVGLLAGLRAEQIEAILLHELAHIRRRDYLVNILQRAVEALLFYHPAVWWISGVIRAERENCCDDAVVALGGDAPAYATTLVALEQLRWEEDRAGQPAVAATGGSLMKRVSRLLYPKSPSGTWTPVVGALALMLTATAAVMAWQATPPPATHEASPYIKWLNQDVVYIIADEERAAFLKLNTDEERKKFVEQFWERRNPSPGAAENVFKEEHYRRIAFANEHWATAGKSGWQTDRGHMYIVYGPPDEIESHPSPSNGRLPFEEWKYNQVEGLGDAGYFTFIDRTGTGDGDYRLAPARAK